ncbi:MAG: DUF559 domain-containing protein [Fimbriimonadaceae bacterium]|nr:MAG: DUF559 domain-containing protein [Fimbriimonadaceae bacterium]
MALPPKTRRNIGRGRELRAECSISERVAWEQLRHKKSGFKFRRQHEVGPYVLDFYCAEASLCVEIDGEQHMFRQEQDKRRDDFLGELGILTIRIPSLAFFEENRIEGEQCIEQAILVCEERSGRKRWEVG